MNKLEQALKQSGVQGLSAKAMLLHAIGYSPVPVLLTGVKFHNREYKAGKQLDAEFLKKERALAEEIVKIIFCQKDSVANNSSPYTLKFVQISLDFDTQTAFRKAVVFYRAAGKREAMVRVTISGVGIDSPSNLEIDLSAAWVTEWYQNFRVRGEFITPPPDEILEDACQEEDAPSKEDDAPGQDCQVPAVRISEVELDEVPQVLTIPLVLSFQHGGTEADQHGPRLLGRSSPDYVAMARPRGPC
jgi:hypothetical protein